jgi:thymidylate synthase (FAD)
MGRNLDDMVFSLELDKFNNMCYTYYKLLLDRGVAREQARMVLPQSLYTIFYAKVDLHNLLHFIGLRSNEHAQWEIQQYSNAMLEMIEPIVPWTVEAWRDCNNGYKTSSGI